MSRRNIILNLTLFLVFSCSKRSLDLNEEYSYSNNPVKIVFSEYRDEQIREKWSEFLTQHNMSQDGYVTMDFNPVTSYIDDIHFWATQPRIISDTLIAYDRDAVIEKVLEFLDTWKGLFGTGAESLIMYKFEYRSDFRLFTISFIQKKLNGQDVSFILNPEIVIGVTDSGNFRYLYNSLVPDLGLTVPDRYDHDKILSNIIGYSYVYPPNSGEVVRVFTEDDRYEVSENFNVYVERTELEYYVYFLKCVNVIEQDGSSTYSVYCHPETGEIVLINSN
ncbi:hypothetical protein ACFL4T_00160 [candidate division KSB1 bacterium]